MKQPLNYAILLYFTKHAEGDADSIVRELSPEYGRYRAFKKKGVIEALMTSKENGILEEVRSELAGDTTGGAAASGENGSPEPAPEGMPDADELRVWYRLTDYGADLIKRFLS